MRGFSRVFLTYIFLFLTTIIIRQNPAKTIFAQSPPTISAISDTGTTGMYEKFEATFSVTTSSKNPFLPYDEMPTPVPGLTTKKGVSVDGIFLPPGQTDWNNSYRQPGFYYNYYSENGGLYMSTGQSAWKIRFAPDKTGTWQYKIAVKDAMGSSESPVRTFSVTSSSNHGFVKVSKNDSRYFEFSDGTYFPGLAVNDSMDKNNPQNNQATLNKYGTNGIQLLRFWLSGWSIFGSQWTPWEMVKGTYDGYLPRTGLINNRAESTPSIPASTLTLVYAEDTSGNQNTYWFDACNLSVTGGSQVRFAIKPNTSYHFKIRYQAKGISGPRVEDLSNFPNRDNYGFVLKRQNPQDGNWHGFQTAINKRCWNYSSNNADSGVRLSGYAKDTPGWTQDAAGTWTSPNWAYLETDWKSGPSDTSTPILYLALENANNLTATVNGLSYNWHPYVYIDRIEMKENLGSGQLGPNLIYRSSFSFLENLNDRNAYAFDKALELAKQNGVYIKTVILEKDESTENEIDPATGLHADFNANNFFGNWRRLGPIRWLQQAWWRYIQARWGYSTAIHSWELVNEGAVANGNHYALTDELGKYMHCTAFGITVPFGDGQKCNFSHPNSHLVTTSFWYGFDKTGFWGNVNYPNLDYGDIHEYIDKTADPTHYYDTALATFDLSMNYGALQPGGVGKPVIRGETGLVTGGNTNAASSEMDINGVWLHNFIWGTINPGGMLEEWWHISQIGNFWGYYKHFYDFISNIPLNKGGYTDASAVVSDPNMRAWGQKNTASGLAHLWINNKNNTWDKVKAGNVSLLNETVTISGFTPNKSYPVEWWKFDSSVNLAKSTSTITSNAQGQIVLTLPSVMDAAVKIGDYSQVFPTPTQSTCVKASQGDLNCDGAIDIFDYNMILGNFGKNGTSGFVTSDINKDGKVDIFDYNFLIGNFGK